MSDITTTINFVKLAITAGEALSEALGKAKADLDSGTKTLQDLLADIEKNRVEMHEKLAADRKDADTDFDKKFDLPKSE